MKLLRRLLLSAVIISTALIISGCWNYRELNELSLISGIAIDWNEETKEYQLTAEIVEFKMTQGERMTATSRIVEASGVTMFDADRNMIKVNSWRLYWGHTKTVIISQAVARRGIAPVIDWLYRDQEPRLELLLLISKEKTAGEIFKCQDTSSQMLNFDIYNMLMSQKSLGAAPRVELYKFVDELSTDGLSPVLPTIHTIVSDGKLSPEVSGSAIFKNGKLIGFLDDSDTKYLLFVKDQIVNTLLTEKEGSSNANANITLEIFKNNTKLQPVYSDGVLGIQIACNLKASLMEYSASADFSDEKKISRMQSDAEALLNKRIKELISKMQKQYDADIFGFGSRIRAEYPDIWKEISPDWDENFSELKVTVDSHILITDTGFSTKPIKIGD